MPPLQHNKPGSTAQQVVVTLAQQLGLFALQFLSSKCLGWHVSMSEGSLALLDGTERKSALTPLNYLHMNYILQTGSPNNALSHIDKEKKNHTSLFKLNVSKLYPS